ncbi:MAG: hypothetical protein HY814_00735, partial [Candidatus Riflebacteria bacterium]|nr:hypothetical protein [Candidatus Riflebacteria bacterium]
MARFQAQTNAVLEQELLELGEQLQLRRNQKADLLREFASLASWVVRQALAGRRIEARRGKAREELRNPMLERLRGRQEQPPGALPCTLTEAEVARLHAVLARPFSPTPGLRRVLAALADPKRSPPDSSGKTPRVRPWACVWRCSDGSTERELSAGVRHCHGRGARGGLAWPPCPS